MVVGRETRRHIIGLHQKGHQAGAIVAMLPGVPLTRQTVNNIIRKWQKTKRITPKKGGGPKRTARTAAIRQSIRNKIQRNPKRSMRRLALEAGVSPRTVGRIVKLDLRLKSLRMSRVQFLSQEHKRKRLARAKIVRNKLRLSGWENCLWSDEKLFTTNGWLHPQNMRVLGASVSSIPIEKRSVTRTQSAGKLMVWGGISARGPTDLVFFDAGDRITAERYRDKVLIPQVLHAKDTIFGGTPFVFQQDGASSHTAKATQAWLTAHGIDFIQKDEWPPCSPDLNPLDFSIWSLLESRIQPKDRATKKKLKAALKREWERIPTSVFCATAMAAPKRFNLVIAAKGGHIE